MGWLSVDCYCYLLTFGFGEGVQKDLLFEVETSRVNFLVSFNSDDQRNTDVATTADVTTYKSKSSR